MLLPAAAAAQAETFRIALPELVATYSSDPTIAPSERDMAFDLGTEFAEVHAARVVVTAHITLGLYRGYSLIGGPPTCSLEFDPQQLPGRLPGPADTVLPDTSTSCSSWSYEYAFYPGVQFFLHPPGYYGGPGAWTDSPSATDFSGELVFENLWAPDLSFLREGTYHISASAAFVNVVLATEVVWEVEPWVLRISQAELVVEATPVPEPCALLPLAAGAMVVLRKRRRSLRIE